MPLTTDELRLSGILNHGVYAVIPLSSNARQTRSAVAPNPNRAVSTTRS